MDAPDVGSERLVDAIGCDPHRLCSRETLEALFGRLIAELELHPLGAGVWHVFPGGGGVTGMQMLSESHLTCHTFPEHAHAAFDLYCCRPRPEWPWESRLREALGAQVVRVRSIERGPR